MSISQESLEKAAQMLQVEPEETPAETAPEEVEAQAPEEAAEPNETLTEEANETPDKPKEEENPQFKQFAEREREFRKKELEFKRQSEELSKRMSQLEERENKLRDPNTVFDVLDSMGLNMEQFQRKILTGEIQLEKPEVDPVAQEQQRLNKELEDLKAFREQVQKQQREAEIQQHLNAFRNEVKVAVPQYENLTEWFGDSVEEAVKEVEQAAELYATEYNEAPEVNEIMSNLDTFYGKKLEKIKSKYQAKAPAKQEEPEQKPVGKTLTHNHTRSVSADTSKDDVVSQVLKGSARDIMQDRAMSLFKKHGL